MVPYFIMIFLTADRLANAILSFHYHKYWNRSKTKQLLLITWVSCLLVMICVQLAYAYHEFKWDHFFYTYVYPIIECTFILTAFVTYASIIYIFYRSRQNLWGKEKRSRNERIGRTRQKKVNSSNFRKQYLIPTLLISTFIVFMTVPDFTYLFVAVIYKSPSELLDVLCSCSYAVSNLADGVIYVFFVPDIRRFLREWYMSLLRRMSCCCDRRLLGADVFVIYNRRVSHVVLNRSMRNVDTCDFVSSNTPGIIR